MLNAAQMYSRDLSGGHGTLDPLHIHVEYLRPVPQGAFHVTLEKLHAGTGSLVVKTEIISPETDGPAFCMAIARLGKLQMAPGGLSIQPAIGGLPNRVTDCARQTNALFYVANPPVSSIRAYLPKGGDSLFWSPSFGGRSSRYQWAKLDNEQLFQQEHILLLVGLVH